MDADRAYFMLGKVLPSVVTGGMLVVMGCLMVTKQVKIGKFRESVPEFRKADSKKQHKDFPA